MTCYQWIVSFSACLLFSFSGSIYASLDSSSQDGHILFLIQQGEHLQALKLYQEEVKAKEKHNYELLNHMGLAILDYGSRQSDPEIQLLTLFGAQISANDEACGILEGCLKSRYPEIQLLALASLSQMQQDQADQAIFRMLGSAHGLVRFEAIAYLCKKKHPLAIDQAESLMVKSPKEILVLYPPLLVDLGNAKSIRVLRKLINNPSADVRQSVILNAALHGRDDFLPQIRQQTLHFHFAQQEVCAYALGLLKDEQSIDKLNKLSQSQYPSVALAANWALYQLGKTSALKAIEEAALKNDLFAIQTLGTFNAESSSTLLQLLKNADMQVKFNAQIALLNQHHPDSLENIEQILIKDNRDLGFVALKSPGKTFKAWKVISGASELLKEDADAYKTQLELKEWILLNIREISESKFLKIAHSLFTAQQNELVPNLVTLLEEIETPEAVACLKKYQQKLGAPLIRNYCNLALYRLGEPGPYSHQLRQAIKNQSQSDLIQFQPHDPWKKSSHNYELTPAETSRLLIESFQAFAIQQDKEGVELLIDVIATGNVKNKYALAGLLLRAAQ